MFRNLGKTLMFLRELHGVSQAELSRRAGIGKSQLSKYERGREQPKLAALGRLLSTLGVSLKAFSQLLEYIDSMSAKQGVIVPPVGPPSASTLLGPDVQKAIEDLLKNVLALEREVLMSFFLQNMNNSKSLGQAKPRSPARRQGEGDAE